jgi:hypothetical protein
MSLVAEVVNQERFLTIENYSLPDDLRYLRNVRRFVPYLVSASGVAVEHSSELPIEACEDQHHLSFDDAVNAAFMTPGTQVACIPEVAPPPPVGDVPGHVMKYIERGWEVFPIRWGTKDKFFDTTYKEGGSGYSWQRQATNDLDQVKQWAKDYPGCNWGIRTGSTSGFFVIDMDSPEALRYVYNTGLKITYLVRTGHKDGNRLQAYIRQPEGVKIKTLSDILKGREDYVNGLDVRGDQNGYVVAPPSLHPHNNYYRVILDGELPNSPQALLDLVIDNRVEEPPVDLSDLPELTDGQKLLGIDTFLQDCRAYQKYLETTDIDTNDSNDKLNILAGAAGKRIIRGVFTEEWAIEQIEAASAIYIAYDRRGYKGTLKSGLKYGLQRPWDPTLDEERLQAKLVGIFGDPEDFKARPLPPGAYAELPAAAIEHEAQRQVTASVAEPPVARWTIDDLDDPRCIEAPDAVWIIPGLLQENKAHILVADEGAGKTNFTLAMARALTEGRPFLGYEIEKRPVLYIDRENERTTIRNRMAWLGFEIRNPLFKIFSLQSGSPYQPFGPDHPELIEWIARQTVKPLVVFDSLIRFLPSGNVSNEEEVKAYNQYLMQLRSMDCNTWTLHHTGKGESTKDGRGTKEIEAGCDIKFLLTKSIEVDSKLKQVKLERKRTRDIMEPGKWLPKVFKVNIEDSGAFTLDGHSLAGPAGGGSLHPDKWDETILEIIKFKPGSNGIQIEDAVKFHGIKRDYVRKFLVAWSKSGGIIKEEGVRKNSPTYRTPE